MRSDGKTGLGAGGLSPYPTVFSSSRGALAGSPAGSLARGGGRAAVALRAAPEGRLSRSAPRSAWALPLVRSLPRAFPPPPQPPPPCPATCVPLTPRSSCGTWPTTPGEWGRAPAGRGGCAGFGGLARPRGRLPPGGGPGPSRRRGGREAGPLPSSALPFSLPCLPRPSPFSSASSPCCSISLLSTRIGFKTTSRKNKAGPEESETLVPAFELVQRESEAGFACPFQG